MPLLKRLVSITDALHFSLLMIWLAYLVQDRAVSDVCLRNVSHSDMWSSIHMFTKIYCLDPSLCGERFLIVLHNLFLN